MKTVYLLLISLSVIFSCKNSDNEQKKLLEEINKEIDTELNNAKPKKVVISNITCELVDDNVDYAQIVTSDYMSKSLLLSIADSLDVSQRKFIYYNLPNVSERSKAWASFIGKDLFIYEGKEKGIIERFERVTVESSIKKTEFNSNNPNIFTIINDKSKCTVTARDFVLKNVKYPKETKFSGETIHEKLNNNSVKMIGKFTTKNDFGVKIDCHYRLMMKFNGGEWESINNWKLLSIEFE